MEEIHGRAFFRALLVTQDPWAVGTEFPGGCYELTFFPLSFPVFCAEMVPCVANG